MAGSIDSWLARGLALTFGGLDEFEAPAARPPRVSRPGVARRRAARKRQKLARRASR